MSTTPLQGTPYHNPGVADDLTNSVGANNLASNPGAYLSAFEGIHGYHYSHSFGTVVNSGSLANVSSGDAIYSKRIAKRLLLSDMTLRATAGYWALDITTAAIAGANIWTQNQNGLVIWDGTENDLLSDGGTARGITSYKNALRAFLWIMFCGTRVESSDASFTESPGTWATETLTTTASGGSVRYSNNANAAVNIAVTGTDFVLFLTGRDNAAGVTGSSNVEVKVDGVIKADNVVLGNAYLVTTSPGVRSQCPLAIPLLGLGAGAHTITVTNHGAEGERMAVDFIAPLSARPPEVLVYRQPYIPPYVSLATPDGVDLFNAALETVLAEFTALSKPVSVVHIENGFVPSTMLSTTQARHLNDRGSFHYANLGIEALKTKAFRLGINNL